MKRLMMLTACFCFLITLTGCFSDAASDMNPESETFRWVKEESHFVDYQVKGETVQFRYVFCFENHTDHDIRLSSFTASFRKDDLKDWIRYQQFYSGTPENGESDVLIGKGNKMSVMFVFEGEYLGGIINENLLAEDLVMIQRIADENERDLPGERL